MNADPEKAVEETNKDRDSLAGLMDYADRLRETVRHENELVNHRITWLMILNGFLFTGVGGLWDKPGAYWLIVLMAACGIASSFSCGIALQGGRLALLHLNVLWGAKEREMEEKGIDSTALIPPVSARPGKKARTRDTVSMKASRASVKGDAFDWVDGTLVGWLHPLSLIPGIMMAVWLGVIVFVTTIPKDKPSKKDGAAMEASG